MIDSICIKEEEIIMEYEGEKELNLLLKRLQAHLSDDEFVIACVERVESSITPFAVVREKEGLTIVITTGEACKIPISFSHTWALITCEVHSSLLAVGLTAHLSSALARSGISANIIAGYYHDHVLVPYELRGQALCILNNLGM
ncbi:MAG: ACT domain-containing protein [Spirochaetia bacterium]|nr:ACT domain-containing protein [Spirochaetia bacterium]